MASTFTPFGYTTTAGFYGFLPGGSKLLFPTQDEYFDYLSDLSMQNQT